eukprot:TRINITY_DN1505_c6_g1_i1.p1 TRINITY_DN1505_c6_g1~~TRINITY_DN1505_c6_g1_i1.p1  ORF type:complete len:786 (+),score=137.05 TRINITY_DN1505_c6_g1_i1:44-2359(+)
MSENGMPNIPQSRVSIDPPTYTPGATGEVEMDVGVGMKKYKWLFDGKDFSWECWDTDRWYKMLGKKVFLNVLKQMREEDRSWGEATIPKGDKVAAHNVKVWRRKASHKEARIDEVKVEADYHGQSPSELYNLLHEHAFRATWDTYMKKGFNIARFSLNNDIGYYEAALPFLSGRDFVNQRGWVEMGKEHYMIANYSTPHASMPPGKAIRGRSFITAYYIRPCHTDPTGSTITYLTCSDPSGWIPAMALNKVTTVQGPGMMVGLAVNAKKLPEWLEKSYKEYVANGKVALKGPWDNTFSKPNMFHPRDPAVPGDYRVSVTPLDLEKKQVEELNREQDKSIKQLMQEASEEWAKIMSEMNGKTGSVRRSASFKKGTFNEVKEVFEPNTQNAAGSPRKKKSADVSKRLEDVEAAVKRCEVENTCLKERLAVFSRTPGADPFTRQPSDEPTVCADFRSKIAEITTTVAIELEETGKAEQITVEEYLTSVLNKLEVTYPLPEEDRPRCPIGVAMEGPVQGTVSYDELWKLIEYVEKPDSMDAQIVRFALLLLLFSTVVNLVVAVHHLRENYWEMGLMTLVVVTLGDWCLWWSCRDVHYKDRPFSTGGQAAPLLWPMRLQLIPLIPAMATMLLLRIPKEMTDEESTPTHANIMYRFSFFYTFMRMLLHNAPVMYLFGVAQHRSNSRGKDADHVSGRPVLGDDFWMIVIVANVTFAAWVLLWAFRVFFSTPSPTERRHNICGLPRFQRGYTTGFGTFLVLCIMGAVSILLFLDDTYSP